MLVRAFAAVIVAALAAPALADDDERIPPVTDPATRVECSACHMAFSAALLPARSWTAIMAGLDDHFGENASLSGETAAAIGAWLGANAADAGSRRPRVLRGLSPSETPVRISETPWWVRKHDEVPARAWADPKIGSRANCVACHRGAESGVFEDD
jgi:hypothetical protein